MNRRSFFRGLLQAACVAVASKVLPSSMVKAVAPTQSDAYQRLAMALVDKRRIERELMVYGAVRYTIPDDWPESPVTIHDIGQPPPHAGKVMWTSLCGDVYGRER